MRTPEFSATFLETLRLIVWRVWSVLGQSGFLRVSNKLCEVILRNPGIRTIFLEETCAFEWRS